MALDILCMTYFLTSITMPDPNANLYKTARNSKHPK